MAASNRVYMPREIKQAFEHAAARTPGGLVAVQELSIRAFLKRRKIDYDFTIVRKKRGPKPKSSRAA